MALWAKAQHLPPESIHQVHVLYGDHFPMEVRHYLAHYLESKFWSEFEPDPDNSQHQTHAACLVSDLIQEIENKVTVIDDATCLPAKLKLTAIAKSFRETYSGNPMKLFSYIRYCLNTELRLVQAAFGDQNPVLSNVTNNNTAMEIFYQIDVLRTKTHLTSSNLKKLHDQQEAMAIQYNDCAEKNAEVQQMANSPENAHTLINLNHQKEQMEQLLRQQIAKLIHLRLNIIASLKETVQLLNDLQSRILDVELIQWKRDQQLSGNGATFTSNLDTIQEWCESLTDLILNNRILIKDMDKLKQECSLPSVEGFDALPQLLTEITRLLSSLVTSTFIIEKQPPQVMKTNTRFTATVRLLIGGKLGVHIAPPQVKVTIISEAQANALLRSDRLSRGSDCSGEIINNTGSMEYQQVQRNIFLMSDEQCCQQTSRQLSVSFRNMQLKKIKRAEKKGTESVMDEKFSLLFQSQFSIANNELTFHVWTLSLPVVVIVHGNQEPHAWATVTWDNAFSDPGRVPFMVPDRVPWSDVAATLSLKFRHATNRGLTEENLRFLADKVFKGTYTEGTNPMLSWAQFCKEPLGDRTFTFWEWFHAVMKLTREHLKLPWVDGTIMGFVKKSKAEEMLSRCPIGTFILRFSDSELGGITIAWVAETLEVFSLQPFTTKDFGIRCLADRISDLPHLIYLYPDMPKDTQFGKYYTVMENQATTTNGYVKPVLVTHLPSLSGNGYPSTPQHSYLSPDASRDTPSVAGSYAGSIATVGGASSSAVMDYSVDRLEECNIDNIDFNGFVGNLDNFNDLING